MPNLGQWRYTVDREATALAYSRVEKGGADSCDCDGCRNFRQARAAVFPSDFLQLLNELGIDPQKDAEVTHYDGKQGGHQVYGGWFHFVGTLDTPGDFPQVALSETFKVWLCRASAPRLASLNGLSAVQLEFFTDEVPWLLNAPMSS